MSTALYTRSSSLRAVLWGRPQVALEAAPMEAKDGAQSWEKDLNTLKAPVNSPRVLTEYHLDSTFYVF